VPVSDRRPLVVCSKSTWLPAIRREHAFARLAVAAGHRTTFVERSRDVRLLRRPGGGRALAAALVGAADATHEGIEVVPIAVVAPGHRSGVHERLEARAVRRALATRDSNDAAVVATTPWRWPAVTAAPAARRAFDCADDWSDLIPERRERFRELYRRIAAEADEIVVVNADLGDLFAGRAVRVVPNGVASELVEGRSVAAPKPATMSYLGTLTERLDTTLIDDVLRRLPGWQLHLFGPCQYAGMGDVPSVGLRSLLDDHRERITWHGAIERDRVAEALDRSAVCVVPHRRNTAFGGLRGWGGDVMKLYDYAARGRPIVSTAWQDDLAAIGPPGLHVADNARDFAEAVASAADSGSATDAQRAWARQRTWSTRWPTWSAAVLGTDST
jgi:hypothetical protein